MASSKRTNSHRVFNTINKHNAALKKLAEENKQNFLEKNLSRLDEQAKLLNEKFAFENDDDDDDPEVNALIEFAKDEKHLEKINHPSSSSKKPDPELSGIEQRLGELHKWSSLNESPRASQPDEKDEFAKLEKLINEEDLDSSSEEDLIYELEKLIETEGLLDLPGFVSNVNPIVEQAIKQAEKSLRELEKDLYPFTQDKEKPQVKQTNSLNTHVIDKYGTPDLSSSPTTSAQTQVTKQDKTNLFDAFVKHVKSFMQTVGNCIKKIGTNNIPFPEALIKLEETRAQLQGSQIRLTEAAKNLENARGEIKKLYIATKNGHTNLYKEAETIQKMKKSLLQVQLVKCGTKDELTKKAESIQRLKSAIATLEQKYNISRNNLIDMSNQLKNATAKEKIADENLKNALVMHKVATKSVDKAIKSLEQAIEQEKNIDQQHRIKEVISRGRAGLENAKNLIDSAEEILEISLHRP